VGEGERYIARAWVEENQRPRDRGLFRALESRGESEKGGGEAVWEYKVARWARLKEATQNVVVIKGVDAPTITRTGKPAFAKNGTGAYTRV